MNDHVSTTKPSSWLCYSRRRVRRLALGRCLNYEAVELALLRAATGIVRSRRTCLNYEAVELALLPAP